MPGGDLIAGVGTRPVGLSGLAPPRPVSPMPSGLGPTAGHAVDVPIPTAAAERRSNPTTTIVKVAWVVLALVAVLVVAKVAVGAGSESKDDPDTTTATTENTLPNGGTVRPPTPTGVTVTPDADGVVVAWQHSDQDPADFTYSVLDATTGEVLATDLGGVTSAKVPGAPQCVRVIATSKGGGPSSVEVTSENTNC